MDLARTDLVAVVVVSVGKSGVREVFCVAGRIWQPAWGSRLGVRSGWIT